MNSVLDTSGVENVVFNLLTCPRDSEFVALRIITFQAPKYIAPSSLFQKVHIEGLHAAVTIQNSEENDSVPTKHFFLQTALLL